MSFSPRPLFAIGGIALILSATDILLLLAPVQAQTVLSGDYSVDGFLCAGRECTNAEPRNTTDTLRLKQDSIEIEVVDTSAGTGPDSTDWALQFNSSASGFFRLRDVSASQNIMTVAASAGSDAFYVDTGGDVGLGTTLPQAALHVETESNKGIRLNRSNASGGPHAWEILVDSTGAFGLADGRNNTLPIGILPGAPEGSLVVFPDGANFNSRGEDFDFAISSTEDSALFADAGLHRIGLGTTFPTAALHLFRDDGTAALLIEETNATAAPRGLLTLRNNGQTYFSLEDSSIPAGANSGRIWNFQNLGGTFRVTTAPGGAGEVEMLLDVDGNMTIQGNYFASSGTQLNVPDYVFAADYDLKPLSEVAAFIDTHSHLPDVPSAAEINATGLNMTDMQMRLLKKIEELTLYTLAQEARLVEVDALRAEVARLRTELAAR